MRPARIALLGALLSSAALPAAAEAPRILFNVLAEFTVADNLPEGVDPATETSAEILAIDPASATLLYSNSPRGTIGLIDISKAAKPKGKGEIAMPGEPTSVGTAHGKAYVAVNTSKSYVEPSGLLAVVDLASGEIEQQCDLGGQPDSVAISKDGARLAVAIENERDEDLNDGAIPQFPAGYVVMASLGADGMVANCGAVQRIDVTGMAPVAPEDPEPEYVNFNAADELVVSLQENNAIVVIGADGKVASHFDAGTADVTGTDVKKDGIIDLTGSLKGLKREPDTVAWAGDLILTANEGDYQGGSRGFSLFEKDGTLVYDSNGEMELRAAQLGRYPDKRAEKKGSEPEAAASDVFGGVQLLFVGAERASIMAIYALQDGKVEFLQALPTGVSPESIVTWPEQGLVAVSSEVDDAAEHVRAKVTIYKIGTY